MGISDTFIAFGAGLVSFFAPCVVPLLPAYIGYVTGMSLSELEKKEKKHFLKKILGSSVFYILGFSLVFVILGTAAAGLGLIFRKYALVIQRLGGIVILIFGLDIAGILKLKFLQKEKRIKLPIKFEKIGPLRSFLVGVVFAFTWSPCIGPILGSILALAAVKATATTGAYLLFIYSLGISLPFLILSISFWIFQKPFKFVSKNASLISRIAGIILAILGILLITDTYKYVNSWFYTIAFRFGYKIK